MRGEEQQGRRGEGQGPARGVVTAIEPQARRPHRVNVWVDGVFALACEATLAANLRVGDEIDGEVLARLGRADELERAVERAVRFLAVRPRSEAEVRERLARAGFEPPAIESAVERLRRAGYLDDEAFARYWVEQRQQFRPRGQRALSQELRRKRVDPEVVAATLGELGEDEEEAAYRAAAPQARRLHEADRRRFEQRLGAYLQRRGFDYEAARAAVARCWRERAGPGAGNAEDEPSP